MADQIASLFVKVGADIGDFNKGMDTVKSDLGGVEKAFGGLQNVVGTGLKAAAGVGVVAIGALGAGLGMAVKSAADMEQGIANIAATMGLTETETEKLKDVITDLGLDPKLKVTAVEAAQAIEMLGKNGLTLDEIMGGAARSVVLMQNSVGGDFAANADLATDVMSLFNIEAANMTQAVDAITGVTVASKFGVDDYRLALAQAGGVASAVGVGFDDFNTSIAAISPSFSGGSDAGTSFKVFLQRLVPQTDKAKQALMDLGLSTGEDVVTAFFDANGAMRPMEEIAENLQNAFAGLSDAQRNEAASTIFGTDAMRAALAMADAGGEGFAELKNIIGNTSAEEAAATRMDTLTGAWEIFTGVLETLTLSIGDKFLPIARQLVEWVTGLASQYGPPLIAWFEEFADTVSLGIDWLLKAVETGNIFNEAFGALPTPIQDIITVTNNLIATIKAFLEPIVTAISNVVKWQDVLTVIAGVILSIAIPAVWAFIAAAGPVVALFAALVAASALLRTAWENDWLGIRTALTFAWDIISGIFNSVMLKVGWIVETFKTQWAILQDTNATLGEKLALIWSTLLDLAHTVWQGIVTTVQILWPKFVAALMQWGEAAWAWLVDVIPDVLKAVEEWATALWAWLSDNMPKWISALAKWAVAAWEWLVGATVMAVQKLSDWGGALWKWVSDNAPKWMEQLAKWGKAAWQWIVDAISPAVQKMGEWGSQLIGWLASNLPTWIATIFEWATAVVVWITDAIPGAIRNLTEFVRGLREEGSGPGLTSFLQMAGQWATALWRWIVDDLIPAVGPAFLNFIKAMINYGLELLKALGELAVELGITLWQWIVAVTPTAIQKLTAWGQALWGWIQENMPAWVDKLSKWATAAWEWLVDAIGPALVALRGWGQALWAWIVDNAPEWARKLGEWGKKAWEWIVDMIPPTLTKLGEWGRAVLQWASDNVRDWVTKFKDIGRDIIQGLREGIEEKWNNMTSWFSGVWGSLVTRFKNFFGIHSPSTLFASFGSDMMAGLQQGIDGATGGPLSAISSLSAQVQSKVDAMVNSVNNSLSGISADIGNIGGGGAPTGSGGGSGGAPFVPTPISELEKAIAHGNFGLGVGVQQVAGLTDTGGFASEFMEFVNRITDDINHYALAPAGSAASQAANVLQSGAVFERKVDDVLAAIQTLIRTLSEKGLGNQFFVEAPPNEDKNAKYELIELVQYLQALYG